MTGPQANPGAGGRRGSASQTVLLVLTCLLGLVVVGVSVRAVLLLERIVSICDRMEARAVAAIEAAKPVGQAAVDKSKTLLENLDANDLGQAAARGAKEVGTAAKNKVLQRLQHGREAGEPNASEKPAESQPSAPQ